MDADHISAQYPDAGFFRYREGFIRHLMADLKGRIASSEPCHCLDVGCNNGRYTAMLREEGFDVRGLDFDASMLAVARERHPEITFDQGDAQAMALDDASFDVVVSLGLIQCVPDWRAVLREICRVLKPGGVALVETNRAAPAWEAAVKRWSYVFRRTMSSVAARQWYLSHRQSGTAPDNAGLRKFKPRDIQDVVRGAGVGRIVLHDPLKYGGFHDFNYALVLEKTDGGEPACSLDVCEACRRGCRGALGI